MRIEIRPLPKVSWHGYSNQESLTRPKLLRALVDTTRNEYATGLTKEDVMMLKKRGVQYDLSPMFDANNPHEFWDSSAATIKLGIDPVFLDTDNPIDFIKYKFLTVSRYVANSMREYEEGEYPNATHVIYNEYEEVEEKASKLALRNQAIVKCYKLSPEKKKSLLMILINKDYTGKSENTLDVAISDLIEQNPQGVLDQISRNEEEFAIHAMILRAINRDILRNIDGIIKFGEIILGESVEKTLLYLMDSKNQKIKITLMKSLQTP